jgi:hypothetical protein
VLRQWDERRDRRGRQARPWGIFYRLASWGETNIKNNKLSPSPPTISWTFNILKVNHNI